MTILIKNMAENDRADSCNNKAYRIYTIKDGDSFQFDRDVQGRPMLLIFQNNAPTPQQFLLCGNSYVMDDGKTVATFNKDELFTHAEHREAENELQALIGPFAASTETLAILTHTWLVARNSTAWSARRVIHPLIYRDAEYRKNVELSDELLQNFTELMKKTHFRVVEFNYIGASKMSVMLHTDF